MKATGKVKVYQIIVGCVLLLIVPVSYIALLLGAPAYSVFIVHFCIECLAQFLRMYLLRNLINLPIKAYLKNIYLPIMIVSVMSVFAPLYIRSLFEDSFIRFILVCLSSILSFVLFVNAFGLTKNEKQYILNKLRSFMHKSS